MSRQPTEKLVTARIKLANLIAVYMPTMGHIAAVEAMGAAVDEFEVAVRQDEREAHSAAVLTEAHNEVIETLNPTSEAAGLTVDPVSVQNVMTIAPPDAPEMGATVPRKGKGKNKGA